MGLLPKSPEDELLCEGHYGFGSGWLLSAHPEAMTHSGYCDQCPQNESCWSRHKERAKTLMPDMVADFEELGKHHKGQELVQVWMGRMRRRDPYTDLMLANLEDGGLVGSGKSPKDRGIYSIVFPFTVQ